jgi:hypothetical protein
MFAKNTVSKSMIDAVNQVLGEKTKEVTAIDQPIEKPQQFILDESNEKVTPEESGCVTKPEAKSIAKKEVKGHEKKMHHESFAEKLKASIKEGKATGTEEMFTDNNLGEEGMSDKQMKKREKIVMSMKDKSADFKQRYGKNWKNVMYATATKQAMAEEVADLDEAKKMDDATRDLLIHAHTYATNKVHKRVVNGGYKDKAEMAIHHAQELNHALSTLGRGEKLKEDVELEEGKMKAIDTDKKDTEYLSKGIGKDVADKAHLKHKPGTVKGTMTQIGRFLRGKPEIKEDIEVIQDKDVHKTTTDMLSGRVAGGKLNSFKNFKVNLVTSGEEEIPKEVDKGTDTKEKQKISTNPGPVDIKLDDKLTGPTPFSLVNNEEVKPELKNIRNKENKLQSQEIKDFKGASAQSKLVHSKEETELDEKVIAGTPGWEKMPKDVKDKSGAVHTPMSRAKDLARQSFKKIKTEMLGKISN